MKICFSFFLAIFTIGAQAQTFLNVTNYGAVGDAVQFFVNTVSNSTLVTTTTMLPASSVGDTIEIFQAGNQTYGVNSFGTNAYCNQDLIATITSVVSGTNIYISLPAQNTLVKAFATYGYNNNTSFANAIAAAGTNTVINIPAGTYLFIPSTNSIAYGNFSIELTKGGITLNGAGTNATTLLSQGAWRLVNNWPTRGFLFEENPPIANNYPVVLENMTLDGGVQVGNMSATVPPGEYANPVDGLGWDTTHDAFIVQSGTYANAINQMTWTNLVFQHWRGEMVKTLDGSTNGNVNIFNCVFNDGNASAINLDASLNVSNCLFNNMFFVAEYYQAYSTNTSYFQNNLVTNISYNCFAINGGKGNNPPFVIQNNTFYLPGEGFNGIQTTPADNVLIVSNTFVCKDYANVFTIGSAGAQGTFENSNIVIAANTIINPFTFVQVNGAGGYDPTNQLSSANVLVYGNILKQPDHIVNFLQTYGWTTNVHFFSNDCSSFETSPTNWISITSGNCGAKFALIETNNLYAYRVQNSAVTTNYFCYANGPEFIVTGQVPPGTVYALVDTNSSQIPPGAQMEITDSATTNWSVQTTSFPLYLNSGLTSGPITVTNGQTVAVLWTNGAWVVIAGGATPSPVIEESPGSLAYPTEIIGTSVTNGFTVENTGNGVLSGSATVGAPFSIVSGGTYNLGPNQSQTVIVAFSPVAAGNYNQTVIFTGGNGANASVSGSATNVPPPPAIAVSPGSIGYGTIPSGAGGTNSFTVQNVGGGTLSGTASVSAPFSILSGGSYSLGSGQSQTVVVAFNPGAAGSYNQSVTFTGANGTNATVTGTATNNPAIQVSPGSIAFGSVITGMSATNSFVVQNIGTGTLSGTVSVGAPFSILSGASYSLAASQSQTVTVAFTPATSGSYGQIVTFTGGNGATARVSGIATEIPLTPPTNLKASVVPTN